jgi:SAM-dependent methyltransferase
MNWATAIIENAALYRLWQAPFANGKIEPIFRHNDMGKVRKVLDVGCGPGTNTQHFMGTDYLGIDLNEHYIESARKLYKKEFVVADALLYSTECAQRFDFILVNSFLHHVDAPYALHLLSNLGRLLTEDGHIHALELVRSEQRDIAALLVRHDRGKHAQLLSDWLQIFSAVFDTAVFEPYTLNMFGIVLWNMVYFKGRAKR